MGKYNEPGLEPSLPVAGKTPREVAHDEAVEDAIRDYMSELQNGLSKLVHGHGLDYPEAAAMWDLLMYATEELCPLGRSEHVAPRQRELWAFLNHLSVRYDTAIDKPRSPVAFDVHSAEEIL